MSYPFSVRKGEGNDQRRQTYMFVVDDNGLPKKLGDGTYGAVFEAVSPEGDKCAVKLFYPAEPGSVTDKRNRREMRAGSEVKQELKEQGRELLITSLVLPDGWTTGFRRSRAFSSLKSAFENLGIAVSSHALVMPYYECTLKDLLESGAPAGRLVGGPVVKGQGTPGYEVLERMPLPERERQIAGVVGQIVNGLWALHAAKLFHRDIKPANVMMKSVGPHVVVSLGDFGFLDALPERQGSGYSGALPLGTRHYRSPEQKDYFDLCDVKVSPGEDGGDSRLFLETTDRKFTDTLIEQDDIAEFSKDQHSAAHRDTGHRVVSVCASAERSTIVLDNPFNTAFPDEKTQVLFYKKPSMRTDLFGVGALIFDMLTLGKSPECFYDYLRPWDRSGSNGNDVSINTLVDNYRGAVNANTISPGFAPIFDQVRDSAFGYPSAEIMAVVFRCMMSRASGAYFEDEGDNLYKRILNDIAGSPSLRVPAEPHSTTSEAPPPLPTNCPLWKGEASTGVRTDSSTLFDAGLAKAYGCASDIGRFVWGARRLDQLCSAIENISRREDFHIEIGPSNLELLNNGTEIRPVLATYRDKEQYLNAMLTGAGWTLETNGAANSLIPIYLRYNIRAIRLFELSVENGIIRAKATYTESVPVWRGWAEGDLLHVRDIAGRPGLYAITQISLSGALLDIEAKQERAGDGFSLETEGGRMRGLAIKRLDPIRCHLSMLATYLHHLFFVDDLFDTGIVPGESWSYLQDIIKDSSRTFSLEPVESSMVGRLFGSDSGETSEIDRVRLDIAKLYLKLIEMSEHRESRGDVMLIGEMKKDVEVILDRIAEMADYNSRHEMLAPSLEPLEEDQDMESESREEKEFSHYLRTVLK